MEPRDARRRQQRPRARRRHEGDGQDRTGAEEVAAGIQIVHVRVQVHCKVGAATVDGAVVGSAVSVMEADAVAERAAASPIAQSVVVFSVVSPPLLALAWARGVSS